MRNRLLYYFVACILGALILAACQGTVKVSKTNLADLYDPERRFAKPEYWVYHYSDSVSALLVRINFSGLVYRRDAFTGVNACSYRLSYRLTSGYNASDILQSGSVFSGDTLHFGQDHSALHSFDIKAKSPDKYLLELTLTDNNRQASVTDFFEIDKSTVYGRQNFMLAGQDRQLLFKQWMQPEEHFRILTGDSSLPGLYVNCYDREFPVARPPYVEDREPAFEFKPDSAFYVPLYQGETEWLTLPRFGFFHFRKDTLNRDGLTLFAFPGRYPEITTAEQLSGPLRYISTRKEFDSVALSPNVKAAVDDFWLKSAGSPERALALIQKFYGYAEEANLFFTSYTEGWKTDRGLIYIVLGRPDYVYRGDGAEEWLYGEPQHRNSLRFTFVRVKNPFSDNDFMLLRSPTFKDPWFITVQSWRR